MAAGACIRPDTSNRTGRETETGVFSLSRARCHSGDAGRTRLDLRRSASNQPPSKRSEKAVAPVNQNATTQDRNSPGMARSPLEGDRRMDRAGPVHPPLFSQTRPEGQQPRDRKTVAIHVPQPGILKSFDAIRGEHQIHAKWAVSQLNEVPAPGRFLPFAGR